ncbi:hypothetical protein COM13_21855 [Bacillus pseudomycoides]|nr:hypothetical protein DJ92_3656 [Bacillus pseudomycoides]AJI18965.1 hypothetical protein BG07_1289 [Bacillus pseudomycoides]PDX99133.1 hypothetical protein COO07_18065 [Bacillus pseudomycoides]PEK73343.1 hypothetical protein CN597_30000 [Bacillus pseudomycoides]PEN00683.1 hypothetical protein CN640_29600 [Bacillus pseudomycoides]
MTRDGCYGTFNIYSVVSFNDGLIRYNKRGMGWHYIIGELYIALNLRDFNAIKCKRNINQMECNER